MKNKQYRRMTTFAIIVLGIITTPSLAQWQMDKLKAVLSFSETKGDGNTKTSLSWSLDGEWLRPLNDRTLTATIDSDYSKSETAKLDRLRTAFRLVDTEEKDVRYKWRPVWLIQTEGDHDMDTIHTLIAAGYRQTRKYGTLELTFGASRDIAIHDSWMGDLGLEIDYNRKVGDRWSLGVNPKSDLGIIGSLRARDDRLRYSFDVSLDYKATEQLGVGYHLWYGNTLPNSDRTQWLGITYTMK